MRDALTPLLLFETLRTIGLIVLVPGLVDVALPAAFAMPAAAGDMLAVVLAFAALVALRAGWRVAPPLVWLFTVEGLAALHGILTTLRGLDCAVLALARAATYHPLEEPDGPQLVACGADLDSAVWTR